MKILAVDTSASSSNVAIVEDNNLITEYTACTEKTHSEKLLPIIDMTLKSNHISLSDIDCFAITIGPGSFTGLRVGIATIKGLAWPLKKPVVGVSALKALAMNVEYTDEFICPVLDARKNQVYAGVYRRDKDALIVEKEDSSIAPLDLAKSLNKPTVFLGDGIGVYGSVFREALKDNALLAPSNLWHIKASNIAKLAMIEIKKGNVQSPESIMPHYIRKSYAEIKPCNLPVTPK